MTARTEIVLWLCVSGVLLTSCSQRPNQKQTLKSPSGRYVLTVPIEPNPTRGGSDRWWTVTITDSHGNQLYKDADSDFAGWLNAYWVWDQADRVWLYNSDDGRVFFWEATSPTSQSTSQSASVTWTKTEWSGDDTALRDRGVAPPLEVYPDYIRKMKQPKS